MKKIFTFFGAGLLILMLIASPASAVSHAEALQLKQKIESGTSLTKTEMQRADEIIRTTGQWFDMAKARGAVREPVEGRRPSNPLDEYFYATTDYEWVDISEIGTDAGLQFDDHTVGPFELGFEISFYDQIYSSVYICSNGWISFTSGTSASYFNTPIPDPTEWDPNAVLYAFWDDLYPPTGGEFYYYADAANQRFIVSWVNVPHIGTTDELYTFQIILYANGNIVYNYQSIAQGGFYGNLSCTVGVENADGTEALQICYDGSGDFLPINETAILIGQPDGVPGPVTNLTAQIVGEDVQLNWTNPSQDTNGNPVTLTNVQVWLGQPGNGVLVATLAGTATSYLHVNAPDGNQTYYVRAYANSYYGAPASVNIIVGNPSYVEDFEVTEGLWTTTTGGWEWGDITNPGLFGAHSGTKVWAVGLNSNYIDQACYYLDLDVGLAVASPTATIEVWISWSTESWWDGVNFKASIDDGATWQIIEPESGYTQPQLSPSNVCIPNEPGWSGFGTTWRQVILPIGQFEGEVPIFRWSFGTDFSVIAPGFAFDDMIIWGLQPPVGAPVSGTVTLDGGAGSITSANVRANGLGSPQTNPAANGSYTLNNVLVGNRTVWAELAGYHTATTQVVVDSDGVAGVNLTLVRLDPPAPVNVVGSVDNDNGLVTLNWNDSPDPLVDSYNLYRRLQGEDDWTQVGNVTQSQATHTLPADGVYEMAVSAVDEDVSTPVESDLSEEITLLYGAIPPVGLTTNGNFDDRIRLHWFAPGTPPEFELFYDDSTAETYYGWFFETPNSWFAVKFQGNDEVSITRLKVFFTAQGFVGDTYELGIFEDNGGVPAQTPVFTIQGTHEELDLFREFEVDPPVNITSGIFYIGVRQIGFNPVALGGDMTTPMINSTFYYTFDAVFWTDMTQVGFMAVPMIRCFAIGDFEQDIEMVPAPIDLSNVFSLKSEVSGTAWAQTVDRKFSSFDKTTGKNSTLAKAAEISKPAPVYVSSDGKRTLTQDEMREIYERAETAVMPHAPLAVPVSEREPNHSLDDLDYYIVYRGGVDIAHPTVTTYDDVGRTENVDYIYTVAAHYDNGDVSTLAGPDTARCNMAPAAPTNLDGNPQGQNQMVLTWTNPTTNDDGSTLVDLAGVRVFRNGAQIAQTGPGVTQYTDTPPDNQQLYSWTVHAIDEVPNISDASTPFLGFVVSPWEEVDYEWVDIEDIGQNTGITGDDQMTGPYDLGFTFNYMGTDYDEIFITSNGWVTFNGNQFAYYFNTPIPDPFEPNLGIYAFWDDLYPPSGGQILYYADNANDRFIVSWIAVPHIGTTDELYTFQIVLYEDGAIYYNYNSIHEGGFYDNFSCTVGLENADGSNGFQVCYDGTGEFLPESETAIAFWAGPSGEINGLVREFSTNLPIQNAQIYTEGGFDTVLTDASGNYILEVEPGTYTLVVHKQGYCDEAFANIVVPDDGVVTQNVSMRQPNIQFNVTSLNMLTTQGQNTSTSFEISNPTTGTICPAEYSIADDAAWLTCNPPSGSVPNNGTVEIAVNANVAGMPIGDHAALITISHNDNNNPVEIPVTLSIALAAGNEASLPTEFAFHQNYPNPFNAMTLLRFDVPVESRVKISIYNVMGQEIAKPVDAAYPAGSHSVSFTADNLPSGMYLMRMEAGSFSAMNKMVLLK